jgi:hypothetical protein
MQATARVLRAACADLACGFDPAADLAWVVRHGADPVEVWDAIVTYEFVGRTAVGFAHVEIDSQGLVKVHHCRPEVQDNVVHTAAWADVVAEKLCGRAQRMETQVLNCVLVGAVKSPGTRARPRPPWRVVRSVPEYRQSHAVMARAAVAAAKICG